MLEGNTKYDRIAHVKARMPEQQLCAGLPEQFVHLLRYARSLQFTETPDYRWMRKLLQRLFK